VPADQRTVEQQHGHVQAMATRQLWVAIHVDHVDGGEPHLRRQRAGQGFEVREHLIAELAVLAVKQRQWHGPAPGGLSGRAAGPSGTALGEVRWCCST